MKTAAADYVRLELRVPKTLYDTIKATAAQTLRSINSESVMLLQQALDASLHETLTTRSHANGHAPQEPARP